MEQFAIAFVACLFGAGSQWLRSYLKTERAMKSAVFYLYEGEEELSGSSVEEVFDSAIRLGRARVAAGGD